MKNVLWTLFSLVLLEYHLDCITVSVSQDYAAQYSLCFCLVVPWGITNTLAFVVRPSGSVFFLSLYYNYPHVHINK